MTAPTVAVLRGWRRECDGRPNDPVFPSNRGSRLSTDAVEFLALK